MKVIGITLAALIVCGSVLFLMSAYNKQREEPEVWFFHCAYDNVFWLVGELKKNKPELYKKVSKKLDAIVDLLIEVEQLLQEDGKDVD